MTSHITQDEQELDRLKPVKIQFTNEKEDERGLFTLMVSGMPARALPNNSYIVNNIQIKMLDEKGIAYYKID
jgi:hypothetical protein